MSGLSGVFRHTIDSKGRLSIPSRLLKALGEPFHIFGASDGCLNVYTQSRWEELEAELESLPKAHARVVRRIIHSSAQNCCAADAQGRVVLEKPLREHAGLDKNVVIVGTGAYVEIWDETRWNERELMTEIVEPILRDLGV
jgi:MraZ protein